MVDLPRLEFDKRKAHIKRLFSVTKSSDGVQEEDRSRWIDMYRIDQFTYVDEKGIKFGVYLLWEDEPTYPDQTTKESEENLHKYGREISTKRLTDPQADLESGEEPDYWFNIPIIDLIVLEDRTLLTKNAPEVRKLKFINDNHELISLLGGADIPEGFQVGKRKLWIRRVTHWDTDKYPDEENVYVPALEYERKGDEDTNQYVDQEIPQVIHIEDNVTPNNKRFTVAMFNFDMAKNFRNKTIDDIKKERQGKLPPIRLDPFQQIVNCKLGGTPEFLFYGFSGPLNGYQSWSGYADSDILTQYDFVQKARGWWAIYDKGKEIESDTSFYNNNVAFVGILVEIPNERNVAYESTNEGVWFIGAAAFSKEIDGKRRIAATYSSGNYWKVNDTKCVWVWDDETNLLWQAYDQEANNEYDPANGGVTFTYTQSTLPPPQVDVTYNPQFIGTFPTWLGFDDDANLFVTATKFYERVLETSPFISQTKETIRKYSPNGELLWSTDTFDENYTWFTSGNPRMGDITPSGDLVVVVAAFHRDNNNEITEIQHYVRIFSGNTGDISDSLYIEDTGHLFQVVCDPNNGDILVNMSVDTANGSCLRRYNSSLSLQRQVSDYSIATDITTSGRIVSVNYEFIALYEKTSVDPANSLIWQTAITGDDNFYPLSINAMNNGDIIVFSQSRKYHTFSSSGKLKSVTQAPAGANNLIRPRRD